MSWEFVGRSWEVLSSFLEADIHMRMQAIVLSECGGPEKLKIEERPVPLPQRGEVVVRLGAASVNHRDIWIRQGLYAGIRLPVILGSDGAGTVIAAADGDGETWLGRPVILDPCLRWGSNQRVQAPTFNILGMPSDGTYAEFVTVPVGNLCNKPSHLSVEEAAALPLASLTAYRAVVTRAAVQPGDVLVLTGIGGGVASAALSMAAQIGATVFVTSGSDEKIHAARIHGAAGGVNHNAANWTELLIEQIGRRPDVVIDGAGGQTFNRVLDLVGAGGRVVSYGATLGPAPNVELRRLFWKQLDIRGTTMGTPSEFKKMVAMYSVGMRPIIDTVFSMSDASLAHGRMERGEQFGKIVIRI